MHCVEFIGEERRKEDVDEREVWSVGRAKIHRLNHAEKGAVLPNPVNSMSEWSLEAMFETLKVRVQQSPNVSVLLGV